MLIPEPPHSMAYALSVALPIVWNSETRIYRFTRMRCADAGRQYTQQAFVCRCERLDRRTGARRLVRFVVLADGTVTG